MSGSNGTSGDGVLAKLADLAQELPGEIERLEAQRATIDSEIKHLRRLQAALGDGRVTVATPAKRHERNKVNMLAVIRIAEVISERSWETFTAPQVLFELRKTNPKTTTGVIYVALNYLRDRELLGKAGKVKPVGKGIAAMQYRVLDHEGLTRLVADAHQ